MHRDRWLFGREGFRSQNNILPKVLCTIFTENMTPFKSVHWNFYTKVKHFWSIFDLQSSKAKYTICQSQRYVYISILKAKCVKTSQYSFSLPADINIIIIISAMCNTGMTISLLKPPQNNNTVETTTALFRANTSYMVVPASLLVIVTS